MNQFARFGFEWTASSNGRPAIRAAFTLLEVVLAVSLSVLVVAAIATAIHLNIEVLQKQQVRIEQTQIARNVLMMISSDLRAAFQYKPVDVTGLDELTVSQAAIAGIASGADLSETDLSQIDPSDMDPSALDPSAVDPALLGDAGMGGQSSGSGSGVLGNNNSANSTANQNIASGPAEILRPGVYGNSTELMIDISRLPRIDQYSPVVLGTNGPISLPIDLKTVSYFIANEPMETDSMATGVKTTLQGGLYRRELDRAVAAFNHDVAGTLASDGYTRLIATEIIAIEFRYFNGTDFQSEWDSDLEGGFPAAIEITIVVDPQRELRETTQAEFQLAETKAWRSVVNLPMAEILPEEVTDPGALPGGGGRP